MPKVPLMSYVPARHDCRLRSPRVCSAQREEQLGCMHRVSHGTSYPIDRSKPFATLSSSICSGHDIEYMVKGRHHYTVSPIARWEGRDLWMCLPNVVYSMSLRASLAWCKQPCTWIIVQLSSASGSGPLSRRPQNATAAPGRMRFMQLRNQLRSHIVTEASSPRMALFSS